MFTLPLVFDISDLSLLLFERSESSSVDFNPSCTILAVFEVRDFYIKGAHLIR